MRTLEQEKAGEKRTLLGALQRAEDPETGKSLSFRELVINSNTILYCVREGVRLTRRIAGANGNAVSLTFTLYYVLSTPRVWERLSREVQTRFKTIEEITGHSTAQLQYLDAVIHEGISICSIQ